MLVSEVMRKAVAFLYYQSNGQEFPAGTAFFIGYAPVGHPREENAPFLATAHHVIAAIREHSDDGCVMVRINDKTGGIVLWVRTHVDQWVQPRPNVDFAT
jgi:hypothetical protein